MAFIVGADISGTFADFAARRQRQRCRRDDHDDADRNWPRHRGRTAPPGQGRRVPRLPTVWNCGVSVYQAAENSPTLARVPHM